MKQNIYVEKAREIHIIARKDVLVGGEDLRVCLLPSLQPGQE